MAKAKKKTSTARTTRRTSKAKPARKSTSSTAKKRPAKRSTSTRKVTASRKPAKRTSKAKSGALLKPRERKKVLQKMRRKQKPAPQPAAPFIDPSQTVPEKGGMHPISTFESHRIEQGMERREEATLRQENQKVKNVLASRKNLKRTYRMYGNR